MLTTRYSLTYDANESGNQDVVLNAGACYGFTVTAIEMKWEPHSMTGSSDELPYLATARYSTAASGGTAGTIFNFDQGQTPDAYALISPTTLGSDPITGPQFYPGYASYDGSAWYLHGDSKITDFGGSPVQIGAGGSLWVRATNLVSVNIYFYELLNP